jgi:hypothetical protein
LVRVRKRLLHEWIMELNERGIISERVVYKQNKNEYKKEGIKMTLESVEVWIGELKKRGIKTFEHKDLPEDLKDRRMIIKAKYADAIKKNKVVTGPKGETHILWEII